MTPTMTVEEYRKQTKAYVAYLDRLAQTDPERARHEAEERLRRAGIVDENGELAPHYRGQAMHAMYGKLPSLVHGFHGCDRSVMERVVSGSEHLRPSTNDYDWLGSGIYFWEQNYERAMQ